MSNVLGWAVEPGGLTPAHRAQILALAAKGLRASRIAQLIRKHPGTVGWFMYSHGLRAPVQTDKPRLATRADGTVLRRFTREEDAFIVARRTEGLGMRAIAAAVATRFGHARKPHSIACRLTMLAHLEDAA